MTLQASACSLGAWRYEHTRLLELVLGRRVLVNDAQLLQVLEELLLVLHGHLLQLEIEQELLCILHEEVLPNRIEELAARDANLLSLAHLFREEALVNHFQSIANHVVRLLKRTETRQDLIVHALGKEYLVEWIKLLNEQRLFGIDEDEILIICFLFD